MSASALYLPTCNFSHCVRLVMLENVKRKKEKNERGVQWSSPAGYYFAVLPQRSYKVQKLYTVIMKIYNNRKRSAAALAYRPRKEWSESKMQNKVTEFDVPMFIMSSRWCWTQLLGSLLRCPIRRYAFPVSQHDTLFILLFTHFQKHCATHTLFCIAAYC